MSGQRPPYSGSNIPPEDGEVRDDPWSWLYREGQPGQGEAPEGAAAPAAGDRPTGPAYRPRRSVPPGGELDHLPFVADTSTAGQPVDAAPPAAVSDGSGPNRRLVAGIVIGAVILVLAVALVVVYLGNLIRPAATPPGPSAGANRSAGSTTSGHPSSGSHGASEEVYTGSVAPIEANGAQADCVAPDGKDASGKSVSYAPAGVTDGDPSTAWRCDGDGTDQAITVLLPANSTVARLGLINGYAKMDSKDGADRYPEYRRVTQVRWDLSNGATFTQELTDQTESLQWLNIPVTSGVDSVTVTIRASTAPGSKDATRDAVLLSEVAAAAPA